MSLVSRLFLLSFLFTMACATQAPYSDRKVASEASTSESLTWVNHPCAGQKGVPYKKVQAFAMDANGIIYSRAAENADPVEIKNKPRGQERWQSVQHFLNDQGITKACGGTDQTQPPIKPSKKESGGGDAERSTFKEKDFDFVQVAAPINFDVDAYYAPLKELQGDMYSMLSQVISTPHWQEEGRDDTLAEEECPKLQAGAANNGRVCVQQKPFSYDGVRKVLFGDERLGDLRQEANGEYAVFDYYCQTWRTETDFRNVKSPEAGLPGPGKIVSANLMNTEHTWPQSKFTSSPGSPLGVMEKTDLHHIFPTDTKVNGIRGNFDFAEVNRATAQKMRCSDGYFGAAIPVDGVDIKQSGKYFEPPTDDKGDVARALFYFSVRYKANMPALQEIYLRKWNQEDPPDAREIARNEAIYRIIGVRNPFIDHPEWVEKVQRFCRIKKNDKGQVILEANCK